MKKDTSKVAKTSAVAQASSALKSSELWKPFAIVVLYVCFLQSINKESLQREPWSWPFADVSIICPIVASIVYLSGVHLGKRYMQTREAFELREYMVMYNLYQAVLNAWCVVMFIYEVWTLGMPVWGSTVDTSPKGYRLGFLIWVHYNNKYIELLDTTFMVLRKKNNQISFLHVYHHCLLIWAWFAVCKFAAGGDAYFGALANSFIHVVMYSYYLMSLLKIHCPWKKHVTNLQLLQFMVCFSHSCYVLYVGTYPVWLTFLEMYVMVNMLVLFGNFYYKNYIQKKKGAAGEVKKQQ